MEKANTRTLEFQETFMTTDEIVKLFSKSKSYLKTVKALEDNNFKLEKEDKHILKSRQDFSNSFRTDKGEEFKFKTYWAHLTFTHKDGHEIGMEVSLKTKFKMHKDGYTEFDLILARKLIEESFDINSKTLKVVFNGGSVFQSNITSNNTDIFGRKGWNDDIEGGFNTVIRCLNDEDYAHKHIGLAYALNEESDR